MRIPLEQILEITANETTVFIELRSNHKIEIPNDHLATFYIDDGYKVLDDDETTLHTYLVIK